MDHNSERGVVRKPFGEITNHANFQSPTGVSNSRIIGPGGDPSTPNKTPEAVSQAQSEEALTPLHNLKMLMRVASESSRRELFKEEQPQPRTTPQPDYHHEPPPQQLYRHGSCDSGLGSLEAAPLTPCPLTPVGAAAAAAAAAIQKISRKQKSLGLLCDKFVKRFPESVPEGEKCEIHLDDLAKQMGTERRRIYDIVNVLESVQMMTKIGKNLYQWHGKEHRHATLAWLRDLAAKLNLIERYHEAKAACEQESENMSAFSSPKMSLMSPPPSSSSEMLNSPAASFSTSYSSCGTSPASSTGGPSPSPVERKTSLGVACQKFLMLFLIAPEPYAKINLEFAARVIHGLFLPEAVMKTRIRRLYDIANILQSLQLIQKVQITESHGAKKPAFEYIGPNISDMVVTQEVLQSLPATRQRHSLLTVGKNLVNIPDDDPRQVPPQAPPPPPQQQQVALPQPSPPTTALATSGIPKPLKKRVVPDFGFESTENAENENPPKSVTSEGSLARSRSSSVQSPTLLDLSARRVDTDRFRIPSPSSSQFRKSLLRNSPINLSMDRRNAHIISPLARQAPVKSHIAPTPANCRKISPTGIISPSNLIRSPPTQSFAVIRTKPYSPQGEKYHPKIKYLRVQQQGAQSQNPQQPVVGLTRSASQPVLGLSKGSTLIALMPSNRISPKTHPSAQNILRSPTERRILSPIRAAPNSPLNLKVNANRQQ